MTNEPTSLEQIAARTLAHYAANAEGFWRGTRDHDVSQNIAALLDALDMLGGSPPWRILDFGCGPGRDLATLRAMGHIPVGLDGCAEFTTMARAYSGCEVLEQSFFNLSLKDRQFDGIFANASLFHVPMSVLPQVLQSLREIAGSGRCALARIHAPLTRTRKAGTGRATAPFLLSRPGRA